VLAVTELEPRFVKSIPRDLEAGVLYVSMEYGTVVHSCCCGCGEEVVTPLTPTDWHLEYDGEGVNLRPSVGNWNLPCRSHYIIRRNRVIECADWDDELIDAKRKHDATKKGKFYAEKNAPPSSTDSGAADPPHDKRSWLSSFKNWW
jgi:hypothetical protein